MRAVSHPGVISYKVRFTLEIRKKVTVKITVKDPIRTSRSEKLQSKSHPKS